MNIHRTETESKTGAGPAHVNGRAQPSNNGKPAHPRQGPKGEYQPCFPGELLPLYGKQLGPYGIAVYIALAQHADRHTGAAWPSLQTIAGLTGMSRRQVIREIEKLQALGLITTQHPTPGRESNVYVLRHLDRREPRGDPAPSPLTGDRQSPVNPGTGDCESPVKAFSGDCESPALVTGSHLTGDCVAPEPDPMNQIHRNQIHPPPQPPAGGEGGGAEGGDPTVSSAPPEEGFERFWEAYPKRQGEREARRSWDNLGDGGPSPDLQGEIFVGLERWKASGQWKREGGRFVPKPSRWLTEQGWKDEVPHERPEQRRGGGANSLEFCPGMDAIYETQPWG